MSNLGTFASGTMIGFTANKSVSQATADTATNRVDICTTKQLYLNGERIGLTDAEAAYLTKAIKAAEDARFTITLTAAPNPFELHSYANDAMGYPLQAILTATFRQDGTAVQATNNLGTAQTKVKATDGTHTVTLTWDASTKTYTGTCGVSGEKGYTGKFTVSGYIKTSDTKVVTSQKSAAVTVQGGDYVYFGTSTVDDICNSGSPVITEYDMYNASTGAAANVIAINTADKLAPLASKVLTTAAGSYTFTAPKANYYCYILIPQNVAHASFATAQSDGTYNILDGKNSSFWVKQGVIDVANVTSADAASLKKKPGLVFDVYRLQNQLLGTTNGGASHTFTV